MGASWGLGGLLETVLRPLGGLLGLLEGLLGLLGASSGGRLEFSVRVPPLGPLWGASWGSTWTCLSLLIRSELESLRSSTGSFPSHFLKKSFKN